MKRNANVDYKVPIIGLKLKLSGVSIMAAVAFLALGVALSVGLYCLLAWAFTYFWAWYVPYFWAGAPMLDFWHSLATVVILYLFMPINSDKD